MGEERGTLTELLSHGCLMGLTRSTTLPFWFMVSEGHGSNKPAGRGRSRFPGCFLQGLSINMPGTQLGVQDT